MKLFSCHRCQQLVFFESSQCIRCGHPLAYLPDRDLVSALAPADAATMATMPAGAPPNQLWRALAPAAQGALYRLCGNYTQHGVCNWAIPQPGRRRRDRGAGVRPAA